MCFWQQHNCVPSGTRYILPPLVWCPNRNVIKTKTICRIFYHLGVLLDGFLNNFLICWIFERFPSDWREHRPPSERLAPKYQERVIEGEDPTTILDWLQGEYEKLKWLTVGANQSQRWPKIDIRTNYVVVWGTPYFWYDIVCLFEWAVNDHQVLYETFTWDNILWDVHGVAESTTCTMRELKTHL